MNMTPSDGIRSAVALSCQSIGTSSTATGSYVSWQDEGFIRCIVSLGAIGAGETPTAFLEFGDGTSDRRLETLHGVAADTYLASWSDTEDGTAKIIEIDTNMIPADFYQVRLNVVNGDSADALLASAVFELSNLKNTNLNDRTAADVGVYLDGSQDITITPTAV